MISFNTTSSCLQAPTPHIKNSTNSTANMVQDLNNRACVLVGMGEFAKANHLLGLALEKHKRDIEDCHHMDVADFDEQGNLLDELSVSSHVSYHNGDDDMDSSSNDSFDYHFDRPRDREQEVTNTHPTAPVIGFAASSCRIAKMTRCSHVHNLSHNCQQDSTSPLRQNYHKIYSLPIVMNTTEWESSSFDDRSFVLVFNSAISNHLWGLKLLSLMGTEYNRAPFETANALYLLALETLWNTGNSTGFPGGRIRSVDKLCVPAIFNNLSHTSKLLNGYDSQEASVYDKVLLKSVFWWIDGNSSVYDTSSSSVNSTDLRRARDGDAEIVEAFLDTVFHLIGAPENTVPAAAA